MSRPRPQQVLLLVVLLGVGWWGFSTYAAAQVRVTWAGTPACTGTTVKSADDIPELAESNEDVELGEGDDERIWQQLIEAKPGMRCTIEVEIHNEGPVGVDVRHLVAQAMGPDGGGVVEGVGGRAPRPDSDGIDLQYHVDRVVEGGKSITVPVQIGYRPDGCSVGWAALEGWPEVRIRVLGLPHDRHSDRDLEYAHPSQNPGCDLD